MAPEHAKFQRSSVYIGAKQARRWLSLKTKLGLLTDYELVAYLLDLADKIVDRDHRKLRSKSNDVESSEKPDVTENASPVDDMDDSYKWGSKKKSIETETQCDDFESKPVDHKSKSFKSKQHRPEKMHKKYKKIKGSKSNVTINQNKEIIDKDEDCNKLQDFETEVNLTNFVNISATKSDKQFEEQAKEPHCPEKKRLFAFIDSEGISRNPENEFENSRKYENGEFKSNFLCEIPEEIENCDEQKERKAYRKKYEKQIKYDIRKAPENGVKNDFSNVEELSNDEVSSSHTKLAIKIKFCQDCNSRHLQDTCPLSDPQYVIEDSITLDDWLDKHKDAMQVMNALDNKDPMSAGYSDYQDQELSDFGDSDLRLLSEEMQTSIQRPLYARDSLPNCLELKLSKQAEHGIGVFVKSVLPMYSRFGPLIGQFVQEMDIPDDFSMKHIWEIDIENKTVYTSTTNPLISNWIRYVRPADNKEERNVAVIHKNGKLFLVTSKKLIAGTELTYWTESIIWNRKNKTDKTNCGGCNLNFSHPVYYRLHCCIFHDTNYSLTIRKYHCKVCGTAVLGKENIMKHATERHSGRGAYQCQYCKKFFLRLNYLEMHRTYGCSQNPQRSRPLCDFCGRKFCQPQKLKIHIKRMHSDMSEVLREFQCKKCLKLLGSRAALQRHMKEVHHKDVMGAATCDRCGKTFQNKSNLKIHMLTHSGVKPFKCQEVDCKAAFTTKQCLQFHYKKVHGMSEEMMPKIERSVAYTFDAYSGGGSLDDSSEKIGLQENSDSLAFDVEEDHAAPTSTDLAEISSDEACKETPNDSQDSAEKELLRCVSNKKWDKVLSDQLSIASSLASTENSGELLAGGSRVSSQDLLVGDSYKSSTSVFKRTESASLLVEAALDAAERDIGVVSSQILESSRETALFSLPVAGEGPCSQSSRLAGGDQLESSYMDVLPLATSTASHGRLVGQPADGYLQKPLDYADALGKSADPYTRDSLSAGPRYQEITFHGQQSYLHADMRTDSLSNADQAEDLVVQNLSLTMKEKSPFGKYDMMENEFALKERFEPLLGPTATEQGLDMSTRSFGSQSHHHLDPDVTREECHGVDLRTGAACMPSPGYSPYVSGYSQVDVPRVVSLDSMARSHHLTTTVSRIVHSPPPTVMHHHFVPENETRLLPPSPVSSIPNYNASYSLGTSYHNSRPGYHLAGFY